MWKARGLIQYWLEYNVVQVLWKLNWHFLIKLWNEVLWYLPRQENSASCRGPRPARSAHNLLWRCPAALLACWTRFSRSLLTMTRKHCHNTLINITSSLHPPHVIKIYLRCSPIKGFGAVYENTPINWLMGPRPQ